MKTFRPGDPLKRGGLSFLQSLIFLFSVLVAGAPLRIAAQQTSATTDRFQVDIWRSQDDVKLAFTSNLVQTSDGYLWLSSQAGLVRFDGVRFKVIDADNAPALRGRTRLITIPLAEDRKGRLWIGSGSGLFRHADGAVELIATKEAFKADIVNAAAVDAQDRLWTITRSGRIFMVDRDGRENEIEGTVLSYAGSNMSIDASGDVWIAAGEGAVYRIHDGTLAKVAFPDAHALDNPSRVYAARDGAMWFGTPTAIVRWRDGQLRRFEIPVTEGRGAVSAIAESDDGTLWIGTHGAGLYWFDGKQFRAFARKDGLSDDRVIDVLPDHQGNVWVATRDGLNRFRPLRFDTYTARNGLPTDMPGGIVQDTSGHLWLAPPTGGLFRGTIDVGEPRFAPVAGVDSDLVMSLARARDGGVWVGRPGGVVARLDAGRHIDTAPLQGLPPVTDLLEADAGILWIATWHGLFQAKDGKVRRVDEREGAQDDYIVRVFRDATGVVWGAGLSGVTRIAPNAETTFAPWPTPEQLAVRPIAFFEAPKGSIWVGSDEGLIRVQGGRPAVVTAKHGLPENWVGAVEADAYGRLWLGQLGGLTRISVDELNAVADGRLPSLGDVVRYKVLDGLPGGDPAAWPHPWSFQDTGGRLWFAMGHGIVSVDPATITPASFAPRAHIDEVAIDGALQPLSQPITLDADARRIEVRYTGVDLSHGPEARFRYRLEGFDADWIDAGTQRIASYTRLAPGTYRFRVAARDLQGKWQSPEAGIEVVVLAPFYLKGGFLIAVALLGASMLWIYHRTILHARSVAIHDERSRLARDIHDSLLQGFGGIALQLHAVSQRCSSQSNERLGLDRILSLVDRTLTHARQMVWDIRHLNDVGDLATVILVAAHRIFAEAETMTRVEVEGRVRQLAPYARSECLKIIEEGLTNTFKHAGAKNVHIRLVYSWNAVQIGLRDDGCGFDPGDAALRSGHWGLRGIHERASGIAASVVVSSRPGAGTTILLTIPLRRWLPRFAGRRRSTG